MDSFVTLVGHLSWPVTALVLLFVLKSQVKSLMGGIEERIRDRGTNVAIGRDGLSLTTQMDALQSQVELGKYVQEQLKALINAMAPQPGAVVSPAGAPSSARSTNGEESVPAASIPSELQALADEYLTFNDPDWRVRTRRKDQYADQMGSLVVANNVSRDLLVEQTNEGLILALASAVLSFPEQGDLERLIKVSPRVDRLHVNYRIVLAFTALLEKGLVSDSDVRRVEQVLDDFTRGADASLSKRIEGTRAYIAQLKAAAQPA